MEKVHESNFVDGNEPSSETFGLQLFYSWVTEVQSKDCRFTYLLERIIRNSDKDALCGRTIHLYDTLVANLTELQL
jgi:hypothetical protein